MAKNKTITVKGTEITVHQGEQSDYISLTDIARHKNSENTDDVIKNWLRNRNTVELLGFWEQLNNPDFKPVEFDGFKKQAGLNSFVLTPKKWIETTNAIGIISKSGRYGGTFAHKDLAFEFASWISIEFKLYIIKEFQRLKEDIIPKLVGKQETSLVYANEADLLNVALFGKTAQEWRSENPESKGNIRDEATR